MKLLTATFGRLSPAAQVRLIDASPAELGAMAERATLAEVLG